MRGSFVIPLPASIGVSIVHPFHCSFDTYKDTCIYEKFYLRPAREYT